MEVWLDVPVRISTLSELTSFTCCSPSDMLTVRIDDVDVGTVVVDVLKTGVDGGGDGDWQVGGWSEGFK